MVIDAGKAGAATALRAKHREYLAAEQAAQRAREQLDRLNQAFAAEQAAQADLDRLGHEDAIELAEWAKSGRGAMPAPQTAARAAAEKRLAAARATADAARTSLPQFEQGVIAADRQVTTLAAELRPLQVAVLLGIAEELGATYARAVERAAEAWGMLKGIDSRLDREFRDLRIDGPSCQRLAGISFTLARPREFAVPGFDLIATGAAPTLAVPIAPEWLAAGEAAADAALAAALAADGEA